MKQLGFVLFSLLSIFILACIKGPNYSSIPKIEFISLNVDTISQEHETEKIEITISITDGDGNIGSDGSGAPNTFFIDTRQNFLGESFKIPQLPAQGNKNGIEGKITFKLAPPCCIYESGNSCLPVQQPFFDTLTYEIYVIDEAGNESNRVTTPVILLRCD